VEHSRELARKILKEEGSKMKKKSFIDRTNTASTSFDPSSLPASESRRIIEADGIYYYCWFTAIAAECGEYLGELDTALLAYKSVRAMEDRQQQNGAGYFGNRSGIGVYTHENKTGNATGTEIGIASYALEECIAPTISTESKNSDRASSRPQITVTKTPANTPKAVARKKHTNSNDAADSSWIAMATKNHHVSANHPLGIRRSKNTLFSPVPYIDGPILSPALSLPRNYDYDHDLVCNGNVLRNTKRSSTDSKIGNDLVPYGTLEERIHRCSS